MATAFETFEKACDFDSAVNSFIRNCKVKVFNLDRVMCFVRILRLICDEKM